MSGSWRMVYKNDRSAFLDLMRGKVDAALLCGGNIPYKVVPAEDPSKLRGHIMKDVTKVFPSVTWHRITPTAVHPYLNRAVTMFRLKTQTWDGVVCRQGENLTKYNLILLNLTTGEFKFAMNIKEAIELLIIEALPAEDLPLHVSYVKSKKNLPAYVERLKSGK